MTNAERAEFERQKKNAERQINEMYYGNGGRLKMPDFLSPTGGKEQQFKGNAGGKSADFEKPKNQKCGSALAEKPKEKQGTKEKGRGALCSNTGLNILNMLNLKSLTMDSDRLTVLALCLLLSTDEVDELLLLALVYIML